jgi:hypothetical protein
MTSKAQRNPLAISNLPSKSQALKEIRKELEEEKDQETTGLNRKSIYD